MVACLKFANFYIDISENERQFTRRALGGFLFVIACTQPRGHGEVRTQDF